MMTEENTLISMASVELYCEKCGNTLKRRQWNTGTKSEKQYGSAIVILKEKRTALQKQLMI